MCHGWSSSVFLQERKWSAVVRVQMARAGCWVSLSINFLTSVSADNYSSYPLAVVKLLRKEKLGSACHRVVCLHLLVGTSVVVCWTGGVNIGLRFVAD